MQVVLAKFEPFFPTVLFVLAVVAVPVVFIAIAHIGIEGELLTLLSI